MNALLRQRRLRAIARLLLAVLLALMLPAAAGALPPGKAISQYRLDTWTSDGGLPQNAVEAILQSRRGFLWLATQGGLARYDGVTFRVYDRSNTPAIRNNGFHCLTQDSAGVVWAGGEQGLLKIDGNELSAFGPADAVADERVNAVLADERGTLWVGTIRGLYRYADGRFACYEELAEKTVLKLAQDLEGSLWIGTRSGLVRLREGRRTIWSADEGPTSADEGLADGTVSALLAGRDGTVWVGTAVGLYRLRDAQLTRSDHGEGLLEVRIRALAEDCHGNLWIGTYGNGLYRRTPDGKITAAGCRRLERCRGSLARRRRQRGHPPPGGPGSPLEERVGLCPVRSHAGRRSRPPSTQAAPQARARAHDPSPAARGRRLQGPAHGGARNQGAGEDRPNRRTRGRPRGPQRRARAVHLHHLP